MNLHVDPELDILRARRRRVPRNSAISRDRLDRAAGKLFADLIGAGATTGTFYIVIGAGELHLYSPREVMLLAQTEQLCCDFIVDWHELKSTPIEAEDGSGTSTKGARRAPEDRRASPTKGEHGQPAAETASLEPAAAICATSSVAGSTSSDIADVPTRQTESLRSEPASAMSPACDAGSTFSVEAAE